MSKQAYLDIKRTITYLREDDFQTLREEFNPFVNSDHIDPDRLEYLLKQTDCMIRRFDESKEKDEKNKLVALIGYTRNQDVNIADFLVDLILSDDNVCPFTVQDSLVMIGKPAVDSVLNAFHTYVEDSLIELNVSRQSKERFVSLVEAMSRLEDTRAVDPLLEYLELLQMNHDVVLEALNYLTIGKADERNKVCDFVERCILDENDELYLSLYEENQYTDSPIELQRQMVIDRYLNARQKLHDLDASIGFNFDISVSALE
ncbi:hypothetical protein COV93_05830 [Candidatus Woesearchaeota archaeon CG11_big_fil_rev_8_21_14_0_20_43_8]|nr:MAG: hypothetical protein COV93_05830 [Candidatus Woesearchaeota archaeon CG11_big_fil_rev_8_21_14_0_20_43_8]